MKRNLMAMFVLVAGSVFAQGRDSNGGDNRYDPRYDDDNESYDVRSAPPPPMYVQGYRRPAMPGHGFVWVDGYWSWMRGRYVWVSGYWARPPFMGGFWVSPRYDRGRFFGGFWGGNRGSHHYRYYGRDQYRDRGHGSNRGGGYGHRR